MDCLPFSVQLLLEKEHHQDNRYRDRLDLFEREVPSFPRATLSAILTFMAAISVNLAVVNSLPLPALDGGQMLFVISEALTGRKVDQRLQEGITSVALVFLLLLSFSTTIGDVENIFRGR